MRSPGWKAFWLAFLVTLAAMAPALGVTLLAAAGQAAPAASSKSDVPIALPGSQHQLTLLAVVADDTPAFVLVRLDAAENTLTLAVAPAQSVVKNGQQTYTLAESYAAAGPARAAALLGDTLGLEIDRYLAATPAAWQKIAAQLGTAQAGLSGALTAQQRAQAGLSGDAREWTVSGAHAALRPLDADPAGYPPQAVAAARAVLWQAWARQKLGQLPQALPQGLREQSGSLLTDLTGTDLLTLGETLEFLADGAAQPQAGVLPGSWNADAARYEFDDDTLRYVQAAFSAAATAGASAGASAP